MNAAIIICQQGETWNCTLVLEVEAPGTLTADKATEQVDVTTGIATFRNVTASSPGSYAIKVYLKSSSGSYSVVKHYVLQVDVSDLKIVVKKFVQLKFAAKYELITGKHQLFQAVLKNHFYKMYATSQVVFSNFNFKPGTWRGGAVFHLVLPCVHRGLYSLLSIFIFQNVVAGVS